MAVSAEAIVFLKAALDGDLALIKRLAPETGNGGGKPKAYDKLRDAIGANALQLAGNIEICKYLVENLKFDVDSRDYVGNTPLLAAICANFHPISVYLIESGAKIDYENNAGFTALHYAAEQGQEEIMQLLLSKGAKVMPDHDSPAGTPLHRASSRGKNECVKILLENGADPNSDSKLCSTPLMMSIGRSYECMELLLKAGADPNLGAHCEETTLIAAASVLDTRFIKQLLKAGANPNVVNSFGYTPLEIAAMLGNKKSVRILYPCTSRISHFPDWSVKRIMKHVKSKEERAKRETRWKKDFEVSKAKGREAFERKEYEEAVLWYTKAKFVDPTDAIILSNLSLCWAMLNQSLIALEDAKACVALKPDWPKAHYRKGTALMLLKAYYEASEAFAKALKLDPNNKEIKKAYREAMEAEFNRNASQHLQVLHF